MTELRTKRRYAHELYPHADEWEVRPLAVEVPYLYARAIGWDVQGTSWLDHPERGTEAYKTHLRETNDRLALMIGAGQRALIADALLQGLSGQDAWQWAEERCGADNLGEWIWERAVNYGVDPAAIKPYPCGAEPERHDHEAEPDARGWRTVTRVDGRESDCLDCCEPVAAPIDPTKGAE